MTSINEIKNCKESNLFDFLRGARGKAYALPEEIGFQTTGNIGSLLNSPQSKLCDVQDGIMFNPTNHTDSSNTIVGRSHSLNKDWKVLEKEQPQTPTLYCNEQPLSELQPFYPNGVPNKILNPACNMTINGVASPTLAGINIMGINNPDIFNNPNNDIGYEIDAYGLANKNGTRALGQGKFSYEKLIEGHNLPSLKVVLNKNNAYISTPSKMHKDLPLYQVGDWTNPDIYPNNFINVFNTNAGKDFKLN